MKLVLDESGTEQAQELFAAATLIQSSRLLVPEAYAALARARRNRRFGPAGGARALDILRVLLAEVEALDVREALAERAGELALTLGLRGSDAVHLATYELIADRESMFVAADGDLARAALAIGHAVAVPGAERRYCKASLASPVAESSTIDTEPLRTIRTRPSASASSQTEWRGQCVCHTSIASG